jgi:hypothetical protein
MKKVFTLVKLMIVVAITGILSTSGCVWISEERLEEALDTSDCDDADDKDCDGYVAEVDCNEHDPDINPGAEDVCDDGLDQNCDWVDGDLDDFAEFFEDGDGDGYGGVQGGGGTCTVPSGYVANDDDCDDTDASVNPDADEICDDIDNNCDEQVDETCD